jgi:Flp pilus assembly protein TadG
LELVHRVRKRAVIARPLHRTDGERGAIAVFFALALVMLLGVTALVVDLGNAREQRRAAQAAAGAAARRRTCERFPRGQASTRIKTFATRTSPRPTPWLRAGIRPRHPDNNR